MPYSHNAFSGMLDFKGVNYVNKDYTPTSSDVIGYQVPTIWVNTSTKNAYLLIDKTDSSATWMEIGTGGVSFEEAVLAITDNTAVPPTEVIGDRYIIDNTAGVINPAWDGASKNDIVEFDGTDWINTTPTVGTFCYVEDEMKLYLFDGTVWQPITSAIPEMTETLKGIGELATDAEYIPGNHQYCKLHHFLY